MMSRNFGILSIAGLGEQRGHGTEVRYHPVLVVGDPQMKVRNTFTRFS